ncbi:uncharacterized protein J3D65DRAFT_694482 [Phyllosticta citribraziliensis]|uniref:Zinc-binding loop region of homing endonuclease domain-containing protein n=1 Tax=Phyllosticta citribraziliensis TaxID=989973 RepID=A0ABR1LSX5_9PEZI
MSSRPTTSSQSTPANGTTADNIQPERDVHVVDLASSSDEDGDGAEWHLGNDRGRRQASPGPNMIVTRSAQRRILQNDDGNQNTAAPVRRRQNLADRSTPPSSGQQVRVNWHRVFRDDRDDYRLIAIKATDHPQGTQDFGLVSFGMLRKLPFEHKSVRRQTEKACLAGILSNWHDGTTLRVFAEYARWWLTFFIGHLNHWDPTKGQTILSANPNKFPPGREHPRDISARINGCILTPPSSDTKIKAEEHAKRKHVCFPCNRCPPPRAGREKKSGQNMKVEDLMQVSIGMVISAGCGFVTEEDWQAYWGARLHVSHRCHNKTCINPWHLILETASHNELRNTCVRNRVCTCPQDNRCLLEKVVPSYQESSMRMLFHILDHNPTLRPDDKGAISGKAQTIVWRGDPELARIVIQQHPKCQQQQPNDGSRSCKALGGRVATTRHSCHPITSLTSEVSIRSHPFRPAQHPLFPSTSSRA